MVLKVDEFLSNISKHLQPFPAPILMMRVWFVRNPHLKLFHGLVVVVRTIEHHGGVIEVVSRRR